VAQYNPAGGPSGQQDTAGGATAPGSQKQASGQSNAGGETAEELKGTLEQTLTKIGQMKNADAIGQAARNFTGYDNVIGSTGVPAVDAMLMNMGFKPQ